MNLEPRPVTIVVFNYKGGVAKTTLAISYALSHNLTLVTNDLTEIYDKVGVPSYKKLPERKKTIPADWNRF